MGGPRESQVPHNILKKMDIQPILSLESLGIGYKKKEKNLPLLPPLTAAAGKGELIAVIGRNGIGKSTLLGTIAGIHTKLGGNIMIGDREISQYSRVELARIVGYVSTETVKVSNMRVYDLVSLGRFPHTNWYGTLEPTDHKAITDSLQKTGLTALSDKFVNEISDGERQKAMIARVLAQDAALMVMDEPTAFLDISSRYEIIHLLHDLAAERSKTILFSTHDLHIAVRNADKIWLMLNEGIKEGIPQNLIMDGSFEMLFDTSGLSYDMKNVLDSLLRNLPA